MFWSSIRSAQILLLVFETQVGLKGYAWWWRLNLNWKHARQTFYPLYSHSNPRNIFLFKNTCIYLFKVLGSHSVLRAFSFLCAQRPCLVVLRELDSVLGRKLGVTTCTNKHLISSIIFPLPLPIAWLSFQKSCIYTNCLLSCNIWFSSLKTTIKIEMKTQETYTGPK